MPRSKKFSKCNLSHYVKQSNITLQDLANEFDVSYQQIQKYKSGANEMPLMVLIGMCKKFNCNPQDLYPEIEAYYSGISIPKTIKDEPKDDSSQSSEVHHHHYYSPIQYRLIDKFFHHMKVMDVNAKGSFIIKFALSIIAMYIIGFTIWRALGFHAELFISQILVYANVYALTIGIFAPILVRHWIMYVITYSAIRNLVGLAYATFIVGVFHNNNQVEAATLWWMLSMVSVIITFGYAIIIKKYFRNNK